MPENLGKTALQVSLHGIIFRTCGHLSAPKGPREDFTAALGWKVTFLYNRWVEAGEMV